MEGSLAISLLSSKQLQHIQETEPDIDSSGCSSGMVDVCSGMVGEFDPLAGQTPEPYSLIGLNLKLVKRALIPSLRSSELGYPGNEEGPRSI